MENEEYSNLRMYLNNSIEKEKCSLLIACENLANNMIPIAVFYLVLLR